MNKFFDIAELDAPAAIPENSGIAVERFLKAQDHRIESIKNLVGVLPEPNEVFFLWTVKSFNAFTFIPFLIREEGTITELTISTYSISIRIIDALMKLINRKTVLKVHLLVSDALKYRLPVVYDHLQSLTRDRQEITVCYSWNHSKIALLKTAKGFYVVEGSGNFGENAQHEQYIFLNSERIYLFRKSEIDGVHNRTTS